MSFMTRLLNSFAFFQYALRLFCAALGVGLSAFVGKLHTWWLSYFPRRFNINFEVMQLALLELEKANLTTFRLQILY